MPVEPFWGRRGFRYIPDPLGRFGFGRYVAVRELPDPFGCLSVPERPNPEIMDFRDPFAIRNPVGMTGRLSTFGPLPTGGLAQIAVRFQVSAPPS